MPVPQTKDELLHAMNDTYGKLVSDLARVPVERSRESSMPGHRAGIEMSPADLVAYLIGWNELVLSWHEQRARGIEPDFPAPGYAWNDLGSLAQQFYRDGAGRCCLTVSPQQKRISAALSRRSATLNCMVPPGVAHTLRGG